MTQTKFKLKNSKPDIDFIEWNKSMSKNFDQELYYSGSHPIILWIENQRLSTLSKLIEQHIKQKNMKDPTILEVGCGTGDVLEYISKKVTAKSLIGVDPLEDWLKKAKEKLNGRAKFMSGFAEDLPFQNKSIDFVVCSEVLEHVIDPKVVLLELNRVVKDEGLIIVTIPNEKLINKLKNAVDHFNLYHKLFPNIQKENDWHIHELELCSFKKYIPETLKIKTMIKVPSIFLPLRYVITLQNLPTNDILK